MSRNSQTDTVALALALAESAAADPLLNSLAQTLYGRGLTVYAGDDPRNRPGENTAPYLQVFALESEEGQETATADRHRVAVVLGVFDKNSRESASGVHVHEGQERLTQLRRYLLDGWVNAGREWGTVLAAIHTEYLSLPPLLEAAMDITLPRPRRLGTGKTL